MSLRDYDEYFSLEFEDRGRGPRFDCWGLVRKILAEKFSITVPSYDTYTSALNRHEIAPLIDLEIQSWEKVDTPRAGDIVILRIGGRPWHCGVMVSETHFMHIERETGVTCERFDASVWVRRVGGFFRWKGASA